MGASYYWANKEPAVQCSRAFHEQQHSRPRGAWRRCCAQP